MSRPFFSIVIPALNEEKCLPALLLDLTSQDFKSFEVRIVDGHSSDSTGKLIKQFQKLDTRFLLQISKHRNVATQRNEGALKAKSDLILFFDADCRIPPTFLTELSSQLLSHPCDAWTVYALPSTNEFSDKFYMSAQNHIFTVLSLAGYPFSWGSCIGCAKKAFAASGGFNPKTHFMEDSEFVQKIASLGFHFRVFSKPRFIFSMRRYEKFGKMALISKMFPHHIRAFVHSSYKIDKSVYPMKGGGQY